MSTGTGVSVLSLLLAGTAGAQQFDVTSWPTTSLYNVPGLVEMPSAFARPDGELSFTVANFAGMSRYQFSAQISPRLFGGFRYTEIEDFDSAGFSTYYDRSFDLRFTAIREGAFLPEVTLGLQDFIGTGIYSAEYLVASKHLGNRVEVSAGLGWGRLAGNSVLSGFGDRPDLTPEEVDEGGEANLDTLFRGEIGGFAGLQYRVTDNVVLKAEYSSDHYDLESETLGIFDRDSAFNFGATYQTENGTEFSAYYLYGSEFGVQLTFNFNPDRPPIGGTLDGAPFPITPRPARSTDPQAYATGWSASAEGRSRVEAQLRETLLLERLEMEALRLAPDHAVLYLRNSGYEAEPQALGRAARVMAATLPASVEVFTIVPMSAGMTLPGFTFRRSDLERNEIAPDGAERMLAAATVTGTPAAFSRGEGISDFYPRTDLLLAPYMRTSLFDPANPFRADVGLRFGAAAELARGVVVSGSITKKLVGNLDENDHESDSVLPHVRSDFPLYDKEGDPGIDTLQGAYYFRPGQDLYGRMTAGYLEQMFAGVSSELLWAPYDTPFAFGAELNYVRQRDYDGGLDLLDYDVVTGHASVYYRYENYLAQVDVGRYLAGDDGATFKLERVYGNGWKVGAFATFTDVSSDEFGEGSFDKGITLTIPLSWFTGRSNVNVPEFTMRPLQRDGGARLNVDGRLYDLVDHGRQERVEDQWGRFWR
ncbi:YjbH domain-containing protein [Mangrovicoccus algicola]|uniref:YjbH domain-containing protein n=1 Tax=Mangrovicoccus algicola TaxID=2771008 RepID=A0A8J7CKM1_9RHOB|nr:YjbH domain-containing protein [Mangrovicoccus algicola]MBE3639001.1 YjbH domain-containing protein [Mangrovicoccus algicola]